MQNPALAVLNTLIDQWILNTETGRLALKAHGGTVAELRQSYFRLEAAALVRFKVVGAYDDDDFTFSIEAVQHRNRQERRAAARRNARRPALTGLGS